MIGDFLPGREGQQCRGQCRGKAGSCCRPWGSGAGDQGGEDFLWGLTSPSETAHRNSADHSLRWRTNAGCGDLVYNWLPSWTIAEGRYDFHRCDISTVWLPQMTHPQIFQDPGLQWSLELSASVATDVESEKKNITMQITHCRQYIYERHFRVWRTVWTRSVAKVPTVTQC